MADDQDILTEEEALRLWQKAAQLQAEAARLAESHAARSADGGAQGEDERPPGDGYALVHVRAAALEAGISEEFVEAALADVRAQRALSSQGTRRRYRISRFILGAPPDAVEGRRTIHATPARILSAMEEILPHEPYTLVLRERLGDPARGGTLVFDIQGVGFVHASGAPGFKSDASFADLRQVLATVVPLPGEKPRCEVVLRSPVAWALRINAGISALAAVMGGGLGMGAAVGIAAALGIVGPVAPALVAAAGAGLSGAASLGGLRALYRYGLGRGRKALESALATVAARAEGGWGIAPGPE